VRSVASVAILSSAVAAEVNSFVEINNVEKSLATRGRALKAVDDFTLDLKQGEYVSIVGPSGCGKAR
jgi:ABC-type glutathione transport system ATPase component